MRRFRTAFQTLLDTLVRPSFHLFGRPWPFYGLFVCSGVILGSGFALLLARATGLSVSTTATVVVAGTAAAILFALVTEVLTGREVYTFYHYQILVIAGGAGLLAWLDRPVLPSLDLVALALGVVQGVGRLGCLMAGCCHGRPHGWGVRYGEAHAEQGFARSLVGVRLFPIQAVESLCLFTLTAAGTALVLSGRPPGSALATYLVGYGTLRFGLELARGDSLRPFARGFSEAQWTAGFVVTATVALEAAGLLPLAPWHLAALVALAVTATAAARYRRANPAHRLLQPAHVSEVAGLLAALAHRAPGDLLVACTSQGVRMSWSALPGREAHYALSLREGEMTERTAGALARLIVRLRHPAHGVQLVRGSHGVFHLLVGETRSTLEGRS
ncbi:MAG TPA: prolipoprotein diacylglyceryl transferase family protein [Thermoanaerobaculia bacterium]|nr:prolipoprotein diacylglyceryl transferase family protein [Thermoanaerobaculia bacterium]